MKRISATIIVLGIIFILGLIFVSSNLHLPRTCTEEAKRCPDGSYVGRDPLRNCEFKPCPSAYTTTTTTNIPTDVNLDDLVKNPASYVGSYIKIRGQVVKNVGAFFGDTYYLQSDEGIRNFKRLNESSTGMSIVSDKINLENYVGFTFNGTGYTIAPRRFFYVNVSGYVRDRGMVVDAARYVLEADNIIASLPE